MSANSDTVTRIKETQAKLDELLLRFTDKHPDVIAARQTLAELNQRRKDEIESLRRGDANAVASSGVGASPVFQSIQLALNQADVEIASLRGEIEQHRAKAAELRQRLDTAPKVEAEFAQLNRDYDVNKAQYTALLANYEKAKLGEQADNAGSIRFQIVQPPTASFRPVSPRRTELLAAILVFAIAAGCGLAYLLHVLKPVVGSATSVSELTGLPVLGVVGSAFPKRQREKDRRQILVYGLAASSLVVAFFCVLTLNSMGIRLVLHSS
jgi:polysaccharide chain length determinant protein (PEP-CTERM system associated)